MDYKVRTTCRMCGSSDLTKYVSLGNSPLANSLVESKAPDSKEYPLDVYFCNVCSLSQLGIVIDPRLMFSHYLYHSSVSETFKAHCKELAVKLKEMVGKGCPKVLDIASNDGCLLEQFRHEGYDVLGVDPAQNFVDICEEKGIPVSQNYWSDRVLSPLIKADIITATNVFAHVDDIDEFLIGVVQHLEDDGIFIIEVPWLLNLITKNQFDTIYHEHLSYFLLRPIETKLGEYGFRVIRVEVLNIHGGSLRIYAHKGRRFSTHTSCNMIKNMEYMSNMYDYTTYQVYEDNIHRVRDRFVDLLGRVKGSKIVGYGACAKGITLLNFCNIGKDQICAIADDTPCKQGLEIPGLRIPVITRSQMQEMNPDYILLLAWNFAMELKKNLPWFKGKYIIPIPRAKFESSDPWNP